MSNYWESGKAGKSNSKSSQQSSGSWNSNPYSTKQSSGSWNSNPFDVSREKNRIAVSNWRWRERQSWETTKSLISFYTEDNRTLETDIRGIEKNMKSLRDILGAANRASNGKVFNSPEGKEMMKNLK